MAMIRRCGKPDEAAILEIINDAASAYRGVIPDDCWHEPYMSREELARGIGAGIAFWGWEDEGGIIGVMGLQDVRDVTLIRHAYVRTSRRREGIGSRLLEELRLKTDRPILIGTWAAAGWAVRFYEKHGFRKVAPREKDRLLNTYWSISRRQVETSVVLAEARRMSCPEGGTA
jgi:GNAT superfamily N-acetyltransferase